MKVSRAFLSCTSSPEEIMLADEAPRTASMAALSSDFAALYSVFPASCALAKVFCPGSCAQAIPANKTSNASNGAALMNFDCHRIHAPFKFLSGIISNLPPYLANCDAREVNRQSISACGHHRLGPPAHSVVVRLWLHRRRSSAVHEYSAPGSARRRRTR